MLICIIGPRYQHLDVLKDYKNESFAERRKNMGVYCIFCINKNTRIKLLEILRAFEICLLRRNFL